MPRNATPDLEINPLAAGVTHRQRLFSYAHAIKRLAGYVSAMYVPKPGALGPNEKDSASHGLQAIRLPVS